MVVTAKLKIQLLANEVLIAESEDAKLWQKVLAAMSRGDGTELEEEVDAEEDGLRAKAIRQRVRKPKANGGLSGFAAEFDIDEETVLGACEPSSEAPFIHLDNHCWEAFKQNTPARGSNAISAITLAGTLLCLWFRHAGIEGRPTQAQAKAVLATIGVQENNPTRALSNCEWLQSRSGGIQINPARMSRAVAVARAYCTQQPIEHK